MQSEGHKHETHTNFRLRLTGESDSRWIIRVDQRCGMHRGTYRNNAIASGFFSVTKEMHLPVVSITIGPQGLSAWSWVTGICGEVVKGPAEKGLGLILGSEKGFLAHFNGF